MTSDNENKQIKVKDITNLIKNISPEEQEAAQRAYSEIEALTLGKNEMSLKEFYELGIHAKKRTNLEKPDNELTSDEAIWKVLYSSVQETLEEKMDSKDKANLDHLQDEMESLSELSETAVKIIPLGKEIETELFMQRTALMVYFDQGPDNEYKAVIDGITTDLVSPDKWSPSERVEKAETVLKIINAHREFLYKKQLVERHEAIRVKLRKFEEIYKNLTSAISRYPNVVHDQSFHELINTTKEWLKLTKDLYTSRTSAVSAVKNRIEVDEFIPKLVVAKNGDIGGKVENTDSFAEQMIASVILFNKAHEEEDALAEKRNPLSEELFGKLDDYIKFEDNSIAKEDLKSTGQTSARSSSKTEWFIVTVLSIVALSWGVWTAIGVFILGTIIINTLTTDKNS
jgi:hypothetical protein